VRAKVEIVFTLAKYFISISDKKIIFFRFSFGYLFVVSFFALNILFADIESIRLNI